MLESRSSFELVRYERRMCYSESAMRPVKVPSCDNTKTEGEVKISITKPAMAV